jgi:hypothetical protein
MKNGRGLQIKIARGTQHKNPISARIGGLNKHEIGHTSLTNISDNPFLLSERTSRNINKFSQLLTGRPLLQHCPALQQTDDLVRDAESSKQGKFCTIIQ